ncbi:MAG: hypothetical protein Q8O12_02810 [Candidatus Omnitrophota bacterium]|nr:hypothetical protein [Candidatus Omnitrophota bacterium]
MDKLFDLTIISPDEVVFEGKASSLVAPCALGYLGVLKDHAPLIANMKSGKITLKEASGETKAFYCKGKGLLEVLKNNVTIILSQDE